MSDKQTTSQRLWKLVKGFVAEQPGLNAAHFVTFLRIPLKDILLPIQFSRLLKTLHRRRIHGFGTALILAGALVFLVQLVEFFSDFIDTLLLPKLQAYIRRQALGTVFESNESNVRELETGEINAQLVRMPHVITSLFERIATFVVPHVLLHTCLFAFLSVAYDWQLGAGVLVAMVSVYTIALTAPQRCMDVTRDRDKRFSTLHEEIDDDLRNLYSIYGAGTRDRELERLNGVSAQYNSAYAHAMRCSFRYRAFGYPVLLAFVFFFMDRVKQLVRGNAIAEPGPVFIMGMIMMNSLMAMDDHAQAVVQEWGMVNSMLEFFYQTHQTSSAPKTQTVRVRNAERSVVGMTDVSFAYEDGETKRLRQILNDVTLHVARGEMVALVGDVGCGKSTILRLLMGYLRPSNPHRGVVYFHRHPIDDLPRDQLIGRVAFVPQTPILFNRTTLENLLYGNRSGADEETVVRFLKDNGLYEVFGSRLHQRIGKNGSHLSGGQRQLLWCSRVLLQRTEVLVMDEPTASVDAENKQILLRMLRGFVEGGGAIVVATHDPELVSAASRTLVVKNGSVLSRITST